MTIETLQSQTTVFGNGANTVFTANFVPDSVENIAVIYTNASGLQTTLPQSTYLVAIAPTAPGELWPTSFTVTYPISGSPIASGTSLTIQRILPLVQTTDLTDQGAFYQSVVEQALDVGVMQGQQISARTGQIRGTWLTGTLYNFGDIVVDGANGNNTGNIYVCAIANTSTTWTNDLFLGDWSLALNVQGIVNTLPQIGNNLVFGNVSGMTAQPIGVGISALLDGTISSTQGSLIYRSGSAWVPLSPGTSGQVLTTQGTASNPQWSSVAGTGTVTSVASGTGLTGGPVTTSGTLSLATIANNSLMANATGGTAAPGATTISAFLDSALGSTAGFTIYRGGTQWQAGATGVSGASEVLLAPTQTANNSNNITFANIPAGYDQYIVRITGVFGSVNAANMYVQYGEGLGPTIITANYSWWSLQFNRPGSSTTGNDSDSLIKLTASGGGISNTSPLMARLEFGGLGDSTYNKYLQGSVTYFENGALGTTQNVGGRYFGDTNAITALKFAFDAGNITSGKFSLYGIRNA